MAVNRFRGDAQPKRQVMKGVIADVLAGHIFGLRCNRKDIQTKATSSDIATTITQLQEAIADADSTYEPEFQEFTFTPIDPNGAQNWEYFELTGPTDGTPFTVTPYTADGDIEIAVTRAQVGQPAKNEKQKITLGGATGGTFTLTYNGQTTSATAYNATASTVQGRLEALSNIAPGDVAVTGSAGGPWTVEFTGTLAAKNVSLITGDGSSLTRSGYAIRVKTIRPGDVGQNQIQQVNIGKATGGTYTLTFRGQTTGNIAYNASAATITSALEALSNIASGDVLVSKSQSSATLFKVEFKGAYANTNVDLLSGDGTNLTGVSSAVVTLIQQGKGAIDAIYDVNVLSGWPTTNGGQIRLVWKDYGEGALPVTHVSEWFSRNTYNELEEFTDGNFVAYPQAANGASFILVANGDMRGKQLYDDLNEAVANDGVYFYFTNAAVAESGSPYPGFNASLVTQGDDTGLNEKYRLYFTNSPKGGTYTLTFGDQTTSSIAYNANAAAIVSALEALSNIGSGDVSVTGSFAAGYEIEFINTLALQNVPALSVTSSVTGNDIGVTQIQSAVWYENEQQQITIVGAPSGGDFTLTYDGQTTSAIDFDADAATVQAALEALSNISVGDVAVWKSSGSFIVAFRGNLAGTNVDTITGDATGLTGAQVYVSVTQSAQIVKNEQQQVAIAGATSGTFTITYDGDTSAAISFNSSADLLTTLLEAMPSVGTGNIEVTGDDGGPWLLEFTGSLGGAALDLVTTDNTNLLGDGTQTFTLEQTQAPTGPNWVDEPENWTLNHVPTTGETIVIDGSVSLLYGLDALNGVAPAAVYIPSTFTGTIGLPDFNANGYYEYRDKYLEIGDTSTVLPIVVGEGDGNGSSFMRFDLLDAIADIKVLLTGPAQDATGPSLQIIGGVDHASSKLQILRGSVGLAYVEETAGTIRTITTSYIDNADGDAVLSLGSGATLTTITKYGGTVESFASGYSVIQERGVYVQNRDGFTLNTLEVKGGQAHVAGGGTVNGTTVIAGDGILSLARSVETVNFANPIEIYGDTSELVDPNRLGAITGQSYLEIDFNQTTRYESLGKNIRFRRSNL